MWCFSFLRVKKLVRHSSMIGSITLLKEQEGEKNGKYSQVDPLDDFVDTAGSLFDWYRCLLVIDDV